MDTLNRPVSRKSLPLSQRDLHDIEKLRHSGAHRAALSTLSTQIVTEGTSDAAFLHAIVEAGIKAVTEKVEEAGYAELAAQMDADESRAVARRRRPSWANE